jgi:hypothetical protein
MKILAHTCVDVLTYFRDALIKVYTNSIELYLFSGLKTMAPLQILRLAQRIQVYKRTIVLILLTCVSMGNTGVQAAESPAIEPDLPEEVLRSEILLDGRSPFDGRRLAATEYTELQQEIEQANEVEPQVASKIRRLIGLIKFRKFIKRVLPIVPIK